MSALLEREIMSHSHFSSDLLNGDSVVKLNWRLIVALSANTLIWATVAGLGSKLLVA